MSSRSRPVSRLPNRQVMAANPSNANIHNTHDDQAAGQAGPSNTNAPLAVTSQENVPPPIDPSDIAIVETALRRRREAMEDHEIAKHFASKMPEPRPHTPQHIHLLRAQSTNLITQMRFMESRRHEIPPSALPKFNSDLRQMRVIRSILFFQLNSINELPPEILTNIFRYVVWATSNPKLGVSFRLHLTWVCKHWRTIAIEDSTIWSSIWFQDSPPYARSLTWFDRAGAAPLDIRINEQDYSWSGEEDEHRFTGEKMGTLLDKLFTKLSQIRMLIVIVDNWPPALVILDKLRRAGLSGVTLSMERFELHRAGKPYVWIGPGYAPDEHRDPIPLFGGAFTPAMRYLVLNGVAINWQQSQIMNLTTLDIRRIPIHVAPEFQRFRDILRGCPNLRKLCLDGAGPKPRHENDVLDPGHEPIMLPHLITFVLGDFSLFYAVYVLGQVSAPRVRDLTLMNMSGEDYSPLFAALTSRFPELRVLTLYTVEFVTSPRGRRTMVKWLQSIPLLGYLRVAQVTSKLLGVFLEDPQDHDDSPASGTRQILCPKLNILEYQSVDTATIVEWGKGRRDIGIPLRKVYTNSKWAEQLPSGEFHLIRSLCPLFVTQGTKVQEEEALLQS